MDDFLFAQSLQSSFEIDFTVGDSIFAAKIASDSTQDGNSGKGSDCIANGVVNDIAI